MAPTIRSQIKQFVPTPVFQFLLKLKGTMGSASIGRERARLAEVERNRCDTGPLGRMDRIDLREAMRADALNRDWGPVGEELGSLGVTDRAGGVNPGDRRALYYLIRYLRPDSVLEIGTHIGASTIHLAAALRDLRRAGGGGSGGLTTVDIHDVNDPAGRPWTRYGSTCSPREMVDRLGASEVVTFVTDTSANHFATTATKYDLIFLDGDHGAQTVYREIPRALAVLNEGGYILLHDYYPEGRPLWSRGELVAGPFLAVKRLQDEGADLEVLPLGELPWPTKANSNVTSLALIGRR